MIFLQKLWSNVKTYAIVIAGAAGLVLSIVVRVLLRKNATLKTQAKQAKKDARFAIDVLEQDLEIDEQADAYLAKAVQEINDEGHSEELEDPNDWVWVNDKEE